jgi:hypothetical protein
MGRSSNTVTLVESPADQLLDHGLARTVFLDLAGRPPFAAERERWVGAPFGTLVDALVGGEEFWEQWLEAQLYYFLLVENFRPASESVRSIPRDLAQGRIDVREAIHRVALCPSFDRRNPGADTFVTVVMEQFLGIEVQKAARELDIGKRLYDGHPGTFLGERGDSQADVIKIAIADPRFLARYVEREYARLLLSTPDGRSTTAWARELESDPLRYPDLVKSWLVSDAYVARRARAVELPNRFFVRALFVDLFDRLPDADETRRLRGALDGLGDAGPLRSALVRIVLDSGKATLPARESIDDRSGFVTGLFRRLLGREPTERERSTFVTALQDPACRTETVVFAILSHPEYATY